MCTIAIVICTVDLFADANNDVFTSLWEIHETEVLDTITILFMEDQIYIPSFAVSNINTICRNMKKVNAFII